MIIIPRARAPIRAAQKIANELYDVGSAEIIDAQLREPLGRLRTVCSLELGKSATGCVLIGSQVSHDAMHGADLFVEELERLFVDEGPAFGIDKASRIRNVGSYVSLGIRFMDTTPELSSLVRLATMVDGWDVLTMLGYKGDIELDQFTRGLEQHFAGLNLLMKGIIEYCVADTALETFYPVATNYGDNVEQVNKLVGIPEIRMRAEEHFTKFAGISHIVDEIVDMVVLGSEGFEDEHPGVERIAAVLLSGESGVGKTELAKAIVTALDATEVYVDFEDVQGRYVGDWAANIANVFNFAFQSEARTGIILDEFDGLVVTGNSEATKNINAVLKQKLEELKEHPHVFVVMTSNSLDGLDPAVIADKRIPLKLHIPLPTEEELVAVFARVLGVDVKSDASLLSGIEIDSEDFVEVLSGATFNLRALARESLGFSPGDVHELVKTAKRTRLLRHGKPADSIDQESIIRAIKHARTHRPQAL